MSSIQKWLTDFQDAIRSRNYEFGLTLHQPSAHMFGTRVRHSNNTSEYSELQWLQIWDKSRDFTFVEILDEYESNELSYCATTWKNTTSIDGVEVIRNGRATFVFAKKTNLLKCIHSHFSEDPNHA
jgi:ketosteroid isomerase-like protein